jgi:RNA-directed DNA polymerase
MKKAPLLRAIARAFVAGEQTVKAIAARAAEILGRDWRWLRRLAVRYLITTSGSTRPRIREVVQFLNSDYGFQRAHLRLGERLCIIAWTNRPERMQPIAAASGWRLPMIESVGALCDWLWLAPTQLDWYADLKGLNARTGKPHLNHYFYRALAKPDGSLRLIEAPKRRLKSMQRQILSEILDRVPAHPAVHGFVRGRSIQSFVAPHTSKRVVLRMDLRDFFPSFRMARIQTIFRAMGYPESVADVLGGLCTNAVRGYHETQSLYSMRHLPQGAPASPALANICCYRLDCRLTGLAKAAGADYTRYADDLAFSGGEEFERSAERFATSVAAIVREEGLAVNYRKTRIMRRGVQQHLTGLVVNDRVNVDRREFDRLKATLTNCVRLGLASQNRERHPDFRAHLMGRVAFVASVNPVRGGRLQDLFDRIVW